MAEENGLFSGLRFTDILFPAAASIWSAYNPAVGRGLQTGMNLFNSMAEFQNSLKYWKHLKQEQKEYDANVLSAQEGMNPALNFGRERIGWMEGQQEQDTRGLDLAQFVAKQGGLPDAISPEIFERGVAGPPDLKARVYDQLMANPEYTGLKTGVLHGEAYQSGMPLAPGASIAGFGTLGQQQTGHDLSMAQMAQAAKDLEADRLRAFTYDNLLKDKETAAYLEKRKADEETDKAKKDNWVKAAGEVQKLTLAVKDKAGLKGLDAAQLTSLKARLLESAQQMTAFGNPENPYDQRLQELAMQSLSDIEAEIERREAEANGTTVPGVKLPGSDGSVVWSYDPATDTMSPVGASSH